MTWKAFHTQFPSGLNAYSTDFQITNFKYNIFSPINISFTFET